MVRVLTPVGPLVFGPRLKYIDGNTREKRRKRKRKRKRKNQSPFLGITLNCVFPLNSTGLYLTYLISTHMIFRVHRKDPGSLSLNKIISRNMC